MTVCPSMTLFGRSYLQLIQKSLWK